MNRLNNVNIPNIFNETQLANLFGYIRIGDVERKLVEQGIRPIYGKPGHFIVTMDMLNAARGIFLKNHEDDEDDEELI